MAATRRRRATANQGTESGPRRRSTRADALAARLCPHGTCDERRQQLVPSAGRSLKPEEARAFAIDRVAAVVARTCEWGEPVADWHVGDYRFLVLEFRPEKGVCLYAQIWTEPEETVIVEVSSGAWNPTARRFVQAPQRAALRRLGYRVGGRARNYRKEWELSPLADARALAGELVTILVDVLGYRGHRPLGMIYCAAGRTADAKVFPGLVKSDVERMLRIGGCRVVSARPAGRVAREVTRRLVHVDQPFPFAIELKGEVRRVPATYEAIRFITSLDGGKGVSDAQLAVIARECPFLRVFRDAEGGVLAIYDVPVAGTTVRWFLLTLQVVQTMRARAAAMLMAACGGPAGTGASASGAQHGEEGDAGREDESPDPDGPHNTDGEDQGAAGLPQDRRARVVVH